MRIRRHLADVLTLVLLLVLTVVFYHKISFSDSILVGFDTFTYFYPQQSYFAETLRQGRLPLWNPYLFTGVPFLANMQTAIFYPFNLMFLILPVPRAYAYSIVFHVFLAGLFMYLLGRRSLGLSVAAAFVGAVTFMFSGFFNSLVGHINQLHAAAWMPLLFMLCDTAYTRRSIRVAAAGAFVLALQFTAGHAQEFYLTVFGLTIFLVFRIIAEGARLLASDAQPEEQDDAYEQPSRHPRFSDMLAPIGLFVLVLGLGGGLAAVQLLPSLELSSLSIRAGGMTYEEAVSFSLPPWLALKSLLPVFTDPQPFSEWLGYVGVFGLALAVLAIAAARRGFVWFAVTTAAVAMFFAFGQFNPLYPLAFELVPGLDLFRVPARWIYLYTFAISILIGNGADCLVGRARQGATSGILIRFLALAVAIGGALSSIYLFVRNALPFEPPSFELPSEQVRLIWLALAGLAVAIISLSLLLRKDARWLAAMVVVGELFAASQGMEVNQTTLPQAYSAIRPAIAHFLADKELYRVLPISDNTYDPGDLRELREMLRGAITEKEIYDYVVATKWKETLQPNLPLRYRIASLDGYDGGLLPLKSYVELKQLFPLRQKQSADGRLREEIEAIPDVNLLGMLNVKYVLLDRVHDAWVDGVYYDLALSQQIDSSNSAFVLDTLPSFETTSLGIVSHLSDGATIPDKQTVARVTVTDIHGVEYVFPLRAGVETAEGQFTKANSGGKVAHAQANKAKAWKNDPDSWDYLGKVVLPSTIFPKRIAVRYVGQAGNMVLRGITLIDDRNQTSVPVALSRSLEIDYLGDVKIYRNRDVWPRAFVVQQDQEAAIGNTTSNGPDWQIVRIDPANLGAGRTILAKRSGDTAEILRYEPETVEIRTSTTSKGFLVLTDSYYPGWTVTVDGQKRPLVRANWFFKAVELEPGNHFVRFDYDPQTLKLGALISLLSAVAILGLVIVGSRSWLPCLG